MIQTLYYINNNPVNPPKNWAGLSVELNYGKDQFPEGNVVSITDFEWVRENYDLLIGIIADGLTGDVGITEAPSLRIDITDGTTTKTVFNGYIDLTAPLIKDRIKITAKATSHATVDWINQVAGSFTFEYLASLPVGAPGRITSSMYKFMPYTNSQIPNYQQAAIASLMIFSITDALIKTANEIYDLVTDAANPYTTANAIVKAIAKIAYILTLIVTLVKLIQDIIKFIISPVKYHAGMYVRDLMAKGIEYISSGKMTFSSTIWEPSSPYYNEFIIPEKLYNAPSKSDSSLLGFLSPDSSEQVGWYKGTFGSLLDKMKMKYNGKIVVQSNNDGSGVLYLLRRDKNALPPQYQLPDLYVPEYTYNMNELPANYLLQFQIDPTDMNTEQNYAGTIYQVICEQAKVNYRPYVMIKNLITADIQFARASTKTDLTFPEEIIRAFLVVFDAIDSVLVILMNALIIAVNAIIGLINKIIKALKAIGINLNWQLKPIPKLIKSNLKSAIDNREGMMMLSNDHFNVAKILILKEGSQPKYNKIDPTNDLYESAKTHWDLFHYINSFIPKQLNPAYFDRPTGNQFMIKTFKNVSFTWDDFLKTFANNSIFDAEGNPAILESLKYFPSSVGESGKAEIKVRFPRLVTLNLKETFLNPTGA